MGDDELGRWICEAFNCTESDHTRCSTRSRADMVASRRLVDRALAAERVRVDRIISSLNTDNYSDSVVAKATLWDVTRALAQPTEPDESDDMLDGL